MIHASGEMLRRMLSAVKTKRGCSLEDLLHTIPGHYLNMDMDPRYVVFEAISSLVKWGLVEAYLDGNLLGIQELEKFNRWEWPEKAEFFVAPQTIEIEELLGIRLDAAGQQIFGEPDWFKYRWPTVFVLMPFSDVLKPVYEDHISKVIESLKLDVARADDFFTNGSIMADVWSALNHAAIVIADCTGRNPNVFYEIGIAHALGKETILISQSIDDIPFDLRHLRVIVYSYDPRGMKGFEAALRSTVRALREQPSPNQQVQRTQKARR